MTNKKGSQNKDLPDEIVRLMRKQYVDIGMPVKRIYEFFKPHYDVCERTVRRVINYETYKDVK